MSSFEHQRSIPEVDQPDLACQVRGQVTLHQRRQGAQIARFGENRLQLGLRREDPIELGQAHGG
jgi:hypothetical protein